MERYIYLIFNVVIVVMMSGGCTHKADNRLLHAEAIMEEHPDSALIILEDLELPENVSDYDRHLYNLLLSHALYKNFIEITNDSSLRESVEFFLDTDNSEEASKALFILGWTQMDVGKLGDAVVSFKRGLDIAHKKDIFMWEGQCARGLSILYGKILDSTAQLKYAQYSYEAFSKGGYEDWADWANIDITAAYNNKGYYEEADSVAKNIMVRAAESDDSLMLMEATTLRAGVLSNMNRRYESLELYTSAYLMDSLLIKDDDKRMILSSASYVDLDKCKPETQDMVSWVAGSGNIMPSFAVLGKQGKYKEAFDELNEYRLLQDSVIGVILENNVSESADQYDKGVRKIEADRRKSRIYLGYLTGLVVFMIFLVIHYYNRMQLHKKELKISELMANMEGVRNDLRKQIEKTESMKENEMTSKIRPYLDAVKERYSKANSLCDEYYQSPDVSRKNNKEYEEALQTIAKFTDSVYLNGVEEYVDSVSGNLYSSFKREMFGISGDYKRLFLYYILGFSPRSISIFMNQKVSAVYNRKSRLKSEIEKSTATRKNEYLNVLK